MKREKNTGPNTNLTVQLRLMLMLAVYRNSKNFPHLKKQTLDIVKLVMQQ